MKKNQVNWSEENIFLLFIFLFILAWLCPVCNKSALYTDLFIDQFFIDIIGKCSSNTKAIEYETNGQWKAIGEEKLSRRAQREKETYKAAKISNGKSSIDTNQSDDNDSEEEQTYSSKCSMNNTKEKSIFSFV